MDLIFNGDFNITGGGGAEIFSGWNNTAAGANSEVQDVDIGQFHGGTSGTTHSANLWTDDGTTVFIRQNNILVVGKKYTMTFDVVVNVGTLEIRSHNTVTTYGTENTNGSKSITFVAVDAGIAFVRSIGATDLSINNVSITSTRGFTTPFGYISKVRN